MMISSYQVGQSTANVFETKEALCEALGALFLQCYEKAEHEDRVFRVALSGGSLPQLLGQALQPHQQRLQRAIWQAFLADERCVPMDHEENNGFQLEQHVFKPLVLKDPHFRFYPIPQETDPTKCAQLYQVLLKEVMMVTNNDKDVVFDLILLGMGPDGHTCSLFPHHPLVVENTHTNTHHSNGNNGSPTMLCVAPVYDSPKPPPHRITLTLPVLNQARMVCFVCTGDSKKDVIECIFKRPLEAQQHYPAAMVQPKQGGKVIWLLDKEAGAKL